MDKYEEVNDFFQSQVIDLLNQQTKTYILKSQDKDDTQIDDFDFSINEVNEQQCYDTQLQKSQSKIDILKNKLSKLCQQKQLLQRSFIDLEREVLELEEKINQEKSEIDCSKPKISTNEEQKRKFNQKKAQYEQLLLQYEKFYFENDIKKEINEINLEYDNQTSMQRQHSNKIKINKKLEEKLNKEFDQVNKELNEYQNIINPEFKQNMNHLQQLMIEYDEFCIENIEQQKENKNQKLEEIKQNIEEINNNLKNKNQQSTNQLQNNLNEAEDRLINIFIKYNKQNKQIKELKQEKKQIQKFIDIGRQKVNSQGSFLQIKKIYKLKFIQQLFLRVIIFIGICMMLKLLQDIYQSRRKIFFNQ
ncbi:unnamed protein product [Paramecium sonneborni]|uniref:Transmembrane protein n=1 Tax=Paramecium sonneborni TaxID=65129 RepID=A0A8S1KKI0_9CILI|nr:unnamed protein product [Paramecium sonneborni]